MIQRPGILELMPFIGDDPDEVRRSRFADMLYDIYIDTTMGRDRALQFDLRLLCRRSSADSLAG